MKNSYYLNFTRDDGESGRLIFESFDDAMDVFERLFKNGFSVNLVECKITDTNLMILTFSKQYI